MFHSNLFIITICRLAICITCASLIILTYPPQHYLVMPWFGVMIVGMITEDDPLLFVLDAQEEASVKKPVFRSTKRIAGGRQGSIVCT
jgi:hypothetical protein